MMVQNMKSKMYAYFLHNLRVKTFFFFNDSGNDKNIYLVFFLIIKF